MDSNWPSFHDLVIACRNCRLHKPASHSQIQFESRLGQNLNSLLDQIHQNKYRPVPSKCFVVTHPKPREIFAADFRDRVVHHLVVSQLEPIWERKFIHSSFACRKGKGPHGAIKFIQKKVRELSQTGTKEVWALQLDVAAFFVTIRRKILCALLLKHCGHERLRRMIEIVFLHDARRSVRRSGHPSDFALIPPGKSWFDQGPEQGIAIGNLSSQFGANVYLTGLDHFIQRSLKPRVYLRYMDDLLLLDTDPKKLQEMAFPVDQWLRSFRAQQLNPSKTHLSKLSDGISHLGFKLRQEDMSSQPLQVFLESKKKWQWISALKQFEKNSSPEVVKPHPLAPFLPTPAIQSEIASVNSRLGTLGHCRTFMLRRQSLERVINNTTAPKDIPSDFADPWCPFTLKKGYRAIRLK